MRGVERGGDRKRRLETRREEEKGEGVRLSKRGLGRGELHSPHDTSTRARVTGAGARGAKRARGGESEARSARAKDCGKLRTACGAGGIRCP